MPKTCSTYVIGNLPEDQPCYPRTAALYQEEEIQRLQAKVNMLEAENIALEKRLSDTEKRLEDALGEAENLRDYRNDPLNNTSAGMLTAIHNTDSATIEAYQRGEK